MIRIGKCMKRKLTITVSEAVYEGLHAPSVGAGLASSLRNSRAPRPAAGHRSCYCEMAADYAREKEALEWCEGVVGDALTEPRASR